MTPLAPLLGLVPYVWAGLLYGSLAAQELPDRIEFGAVAEIPGGMQGKKLTFADGLNLHILSPTPRAITVRRRELSKTGSPTAYDVAGYGPGAFAPLAGHSYLINVNDTAVDLAYARVELPLGPRGRAWLDAEGSGGVHVGKRAGADWWAVDPTRTGAWVVRLGSVAGEYALLGRRRPPPPGPKELRRRADVDGNDNGPPVDALAVTELVRSIQQIVNQAAIGPGNSAREGVRPVCDALDRECASLATSPGSGADQRQAQDACATVREKCAELQVGVDVGVGVGVGVGIGIGPMPPPPPPVPGAGLGTPPVPPPPPAAGGPVPPPPRPSQGAGLGSPQQPPQQGVGLGPAPTPQEAPNAASPANINGLSAGTRTGRDTALGIGAAFLVALFTV